jgi:hypothetical protein
MRIDQLLMLGAMVRKKIDEAADLRRRMMAMRINRIHRKFHPSVFGQQTNQTALIEIAGDQKSRRQAKRLWANSLVIAEAGRWLNALPSHCFAPAAPCRARRPPPASGDG